MADGSGSIRADVASGENFRSDPRDDIPKRAYLDREAVFRRNPDALRGRDDTLDSALGVIGTGLDLFIRGRNALHRGNESSAEKLFQQARGAFKKLFDRAPKYGMSRKGWERYIEVCEDWIDAAGNTAHRRNCQERLTGMLRLIVEFEHDRNGDEPADLAELHRWATRRIVEETPAGKERDDRKAILGVLFSCPSNRDYTFLSDYLYKHPGIARRAGPGLFLAPRRANRRCIAGPRRRSHGDFAHTRSTGRQPGIHRAPRHGRERAGPGASDISERGASTTEGSRRIYPPGSHSS